ncbi:MAG: 1-acyl-sn-glycerol-3-phosphate acyltransferase [Chthoniobacterales bacterium]|nr:MAG: 1-acyl-sn-glycerol-3-phosphate acyltransferase [Chthoniobacterales bacterium]
MNPWYWAGYTFSKIIGRIFFRYRVLHRERMIETGPAILAMNHQSYLDPPLAGGASKRPIYYLARKTLLDIPLLGPILPKLNVIPVDQDNADRNALKALLLILKRGEGALVFPEGSRTPDGKLQPALPGLGFLIAKTLAPVVPMRIFGAHEALPRGGGRLRFHRITVVVGHPIYFTAAEVAGGGKELYQKLSERVMAEIAKLQIDE